MTLELVNTFEVDGEWYVIRKDGRKVARFAVNKDSSNKNEKLKEATEAFNRLKTPQEEIIILSEEI